MSFWNTLRSVQKRKQEIDAAAAASDTAKPPVPSPPVQSSPTPGYSGLSQDDIEDIRKMRKKLLDDWNKANGGGG